MAKGRIAFHLPNGSVHEAELHRSRRCRRIGLRLLDDGTLRLTAPTNIALRDIEAAMSAFVPWLEKRLAARKDLAEERTLPTMLALPFTGMTYTIVPGGDFAAGRKLASQAKSAVHLRETGNTPRLLLLELGNELRFFTNATWQGNTAPGPAHPLLRALHCFCREQASALLPPFLQQVARQHAFALNDIRIHDQHSRWASCARMRAGGHRINLNWRGVFLPQELFAHLCRHELCHTLHMDHSAKFHAALEAISPNARALERGLNAAWRNLPWWSKVRQTPRT